MLYARMGQQVNYILGLQFLVCDRCQVNYAENGERVSDLKIYLVCVTKYRRSIFKAESLAVIEKSFGEVAKKMDFQVLEFNREADHIHALIEFPPKLSVSQMSML